MASLAISAEKEIEKNVTISKALKIGRSIIPHNLNYYSD
jgi:hypothetical protein